MKFTNLSCVLFFLLFALNANATVITQTHVITQNQTNLNFNSSDTATDGILTISTNIQSINYLSVLTVGGTLLTGSSYWSGKILSDSFSATNEAKSTPQPNSLFILSQATINNITTATIKLNDDFLQNIPTTLPVNIKTFDSYDFNNQGQNDFLTVEFSYDDGVAVAVVSEPSAVALMLLGLISISISYRNQC